MVGKSCVCIVITCLSKRDRHIIITLMGIKLFINNIVLLLKIIID
jgi:hypothetical protein